MYYMHVVCLIVEVLFTLILDIFQLLRQTAKSHQKPTTQSVDFCTCQEMINEGCGLLYICLTTRLFFTENIICSFNNNVL